MTPILQHANTHLCIFMVLSHICTCSWNVHVHRGYDIAADEDVSIAKWLSAPAVAPLEEVQFAPEALQQLSELSDKLSLYHNADEAQRLISQVLRQDIRSKNRRARQQKGLEEARYSVGLDTLNIEFQIVDNHALVVSIVHWPRGVDRPHIQHGVMAAEAEES